MTTISYAELLSAFAQACMDGFAARPMLTGVCFVFLIATTACAQLALDRKGWPAAALGMIAAGSFGMIWAIA